MCEKSHIQGRWANYMIIRVPRDGFAGRSGWDAGLAKDGQAHREWAPLLFSLFKFPFQ